MKLIPYQDLDYLFLISDLQNKFSLLGLHFKLGFELEFYLRPDSDNLVEFISRSLPGVSLLKEDGEGQYELVFQHSEDLQVKIFEVENARKILMQEYSQISFLSNPFPDSPTSSLHISISLWRDDLNLYAKSEHEKFSQEFIWSISGLEDLVNDILLLYVWNEDGVKRISPTMNTPTKICWGINNRSAAFRVPSLKPLEARIENRLVSSSANVAAAVFATIFSIDQGFKEKKKLNHKIYGIAHHDQYELINVHRGFQELYHRFLNFAEGKSLI
jgi:glutamine synthetase